MNKVTGIKTFIQDEFDKSDPLRKLKRVLVCFRLNGMPYRMEGTAETVEEAISKAAQFYAERCTAEMLETSRISGWTTYRQEKDCD